MRPGALCERAGRTRVSYERSFTLPAATLSACRSCVSYSDQRASSVLPGVKAKLTNSVPDVEHSLEGMGGLDYAAEEASLEAKGS
jgi:hypothetical protein